jgi:alpha-ribazole phosphatase
MKVLIMRHGESMDDVDNQYGGWSDFNLSPKGKEQISAKIEKIKALGIRFDKILSSPLKRAVQSSEILSSELGLSVETFEYAKERNSYGILSGVEKDRAKQLYPDQVSKLEVNEYVDGSERYDDLVSRVKRSLELLEKQNFESVILLTHGNYMKCLFSLFDKTITKKEDGGFVLAELNSGKLEVISTDGIEFK